jgi:hypothetical protein
VEAADVIGQNRVSLHLRYLQTLIRVAAEHNHTFVVPIPLVRSFAFAFSILY